MLVCTLSRDLPERERQRGRRRAREFQGARNTAKWSKFAKLSYLRPRLYQCELVSSSLRPLLFRCRAARVSAADKSVFLALQLFAAAPPIGWKLGAALLCARLPSLVSRDRFESLPYARARASQLFIQISWRGEWERGRGLSPSFFRAGHLQRV